MWIWLDTSLLLCSVKLSHVSLKLKQMSIVTKLKLLICSEIQLKSPNWLFGQRKYEESGSASKAATGEITNGVSGGDTGVDCLCNLDWLSSGGEENEEDIFHRYH